MEKWIFDAADILFGGGLADDMAEWMRGLLDTILDLMESGGLIDAALNIFVAISCSLLILYYFMDLVDQAKRDMFSFEKLIVGFIKFLAAFVVLLCLPDILHSIIRIGRYMYLAMEDDGSGTLRSAIMNAPNNTLELFTDLPTGSSGRSSLSEMPTWTEAVQQAFTDKYGFGIGKILDNFGILICSILVNLIGIIARIAGYFICASNAVMVIVRVAFSPIAVVQLFEDGTKSSGMRYLKGLVADCITMAVIIVILFAATAVTNGMVVNYADVSEITVDNLSTVMNFKNIAIMLVPELVAVGAMASGSKVAHDIMGA